MVSLQNMSWFERIIIKNDILMQKIIHAPNRYTPLMSTVQIDERWLNKANKL